MITVEGKRLTVDGPLTLNTHLALRAESEPHVRDRDVEIDLAHVTAIDSSALALVLFWL